MAVDYVFTIGENGLNQHKAYQERYLTKQEVQEIRNKSKELVLKYKGVVNPSTGEKEYPE